MEKVAVIMAGGAGNRFWPLSRINRPKQIIKFEDNTPTLLEEAIERASTSIDLGNIFIITNQYLKEPIEEIIRNIPRENIIAEPLKRNTAPCLSLAASIISSRLSQKGISDSEVTVAVLTADQRIFPLHSFSNILESLLKYVYYNEVLATIGIKPERPETGYGYIEVASEFDYINQSLQIQPVKSFHEKPNLLKAGEYFRSNRYLWNSGMFFYRLDVFINKMMKYTNEIGDKIYQMKNIINNNPFEDNFTRNKEILEIYSSFPDISIDYALMEKAQRVVVAPATFSWEDLGSYDTLPRIYSVDTNQNYIQGEVVEIETSNSILINRSEKKDMLLSILGYSNIVVALTDDAVMICPRERVQEVKRIVEEIANRGKNKWL